jgi:hypothetical protein
LDPFDPNAINITVTAKTTWYQVVKRHHY